MDFLTFSVIAWPIPRVPGSQAGVDIADNTTAVFVLDSNQHPWVSLSSKALDRLYRTGASRATCTLSLDDRTILRLILKSTAVPFEFYSSIASGL